MNNVISKIADYMGRLLDEVRGHRADLAQVRLNQQHVLEGHKTIIEGQIAMNATLQAILDRLNAQSQQIDQLVAQKSQSEQADLATIGAAIDANTAKITQALTPAPAAQ